MTNATHTLGPWSLGTNYNYETALVSSNGETVAYAAWDGGSGCHLEIQNPADAALIIAAPELLSACEKLDAFWLEDFDPPHEEIEKQEARLLSKETLDVWREIRAAIAKAKGGAA